jgi:hypothetical protein
MDTHRSFYLASSRDDFVEPPKDATRLGFTDIPYVVPANDNLLTKESARCGNLLRRLIALHGLRWLD